MFWRTDLRVREVMAELTFSIGDATAPADSDVPTVKELFAIGVLRLDLRREGRVGLMDQIANVPRLRGR